MDVNRPSHFIILYYLYSRVLSKRQGHLRQCSLSLQLLLKSSQFQLLLTSIKACLLVIKLTLLALVFESTHQHFLGLQQ